MNPEDGKTSQRKVISHLSLNIRFFPYMNLIPGVFLRMTPTPTAPFKQLFYFNPFKKINLFLLGLNGRKETSFTMNVPTVSR